MSPDPRQQMEKSIMSLIGRATNDVIQGKIYVMYVRLADLSWLPGKSYGEMFRGAKHWKLVFEIGFDKFTVEFLEDSLISRQGMVRVEPYNPETDPATKYLLGAITISSFWLYSDILELFSAWKQYSLVGRNCQHFVKDLVHRYDKAGFMSDHTDHFRELNSEAHGLLNGVRTFASWCRGFGSTPSSSASSV
ncbi:hypothetical protein BGZ95_010362 [Linnemannia exigua]|uniref:PPPDE domain-containing protein n=1 Tax=Linnemannia exigua TaxID=604196 RepID=A0AAD4H770_9FUNG|nr:hypothetical protein BGZ95_010362 [Linnemannia exigua]